MNLQNILRRFFLSNKRLSLSKIAEHLKRNFYIQHLKRFRAVMEIASFFLPVCLSHMSVKRCI